MLTLVISTVAITLASYFVQKPKTTNISQASAPIYSGRYPNGLTVPENGAIVENADISNNGGGVCLKITGDNVTVRNSKIHDCQDHGVLFLGTNGGVLENSEVYRAAMRYRPDSVGSGWPSLIKVQSVDETSSGLAQNITIRNNYVHEGYGECMGLRGSNILVTGNHAKDCYSIGVYSNSDHTDIERNFVECTGNPEYNRSGSPMVGIGFAEESFSNWGAHGHDSQKVINNIVVGCKYGVRYGSSTNSKGLSNSIIAFNTLYRTLSSAISITYYSSQSGNLIENNIASSVSANSSGATIAGNVSYTFSPSSVPEDFILRSPLPAQGSYSVLTDYFNHRRADPFDAGAVDYGGTSLTITITPTGSGKPGDCGGPNGTPDGFVDLFDYGSLSRSFGLTQGQQGYNTKCDFYVDSHNIIDLLDYGILAQNFGR